MIKLFQLDRLWSEIGQEALTNINDVSKHGWGQKGPSIEKLEEWLCNYSGRKHAITVGSGTDALNCILQCIDLPKHACVAVPSYTFTATASAIPRSGLTPVFVDCNSDFHIDLDQVPENIPAIIVVDLFGKAMDYDKIAEFQSRNPTTAIIMDAAQSIETQYKGQSSMKVGIASAVSFAPTKTIPTFGSGGAVLTDDDNLAALARLWRTHGKTKNNQQAVMIGANSMMSSMEAAQLLACVSRHSTWRDRREKIAMLYTLSNNSSRITTPTSRGQHTWHKFVVTCDSASTREELRTFMLSRGIQTEIYYELLIHREEIFRDNYTNLPQSDQLSNISLALPCQHTLTDNEITIISQALKDFK